MDGNYREINDSLLNSFFSTKSIDFLISIKLHTVHFFLIFMFMLIVNDANWFAKKTELCPIRITYSGKLLKRVALFPCASGAIHFVSSNVERLQQ